LVIKNKMKKVLKSSAFLLISLLYSFQSTAADTPPELGIYENPDQYIPDDLVFTDENYNVINLKEEIDKPTVIALVSQSGFY
jgi:hypothetical protein